jgi:formamidopyrimidine-DNA glycosylase
MPELPEVETVLRGLKRKIGGMPICQLDSLYKGTVIYDKDIIQPLFPAEVIEYERRGKYIILHLASKNALIIHLRMTGKLIYTEEDNDEAQHVRALLSLTGCARVLFNDVRTFGKIIVTPVSKISDYLPKLGPEPLSDEFNADYLKQALSKRTMPIKTALLDQAVIAGLGNIYVCEILYRAKLSPLRKANSLSLAQLKQITKLTKEIMTEAIAKNGTSVSDFRQIDDKTGEFQNFLQVYQKQTCPLGHELKRIKQSGRSSFYCPVCQK